MYLAIKASVTDTNIRVATLAKWVRSVTTVGDKSLSHALVIARSMIFGEAWELDNNWMLEEKPAPTGVLITKVAVFDEYDIEQAKFEETVASHKALLQRAVNGDAAAALEYCKLEFNGEIYRPISAAYC